MACLICEEIDKAAMRKVKAEGYGSDSSRSLEARAKVSERLREEIAAELVAIGWARLMGK